MNDTAWRVLIVVSSLPALIIVALFLTTPKIPDSLFGLLLFSVLLNSFYSRRRRQLSSPSVVEMTWHERWGWKVIIFLIIAAAVAGLFSVPSPPGTFLSYISLILTAISILLWGRARPRTEVKKPENEPSAPPDSLS